MLHLEHYGRPVDNNRVYAIDWSGCGFGDECAYRANLDQELRRALHPQVPTLARGEALFPDAERQ